MYEFFQPRKKLVQYPAITHVALVPLDPHTYYVIARVEPGPQWWEASAPSTVSLLLPLPEPKQPYKKREKIYYEIN